MFTTLTKAGYPKEVFVLEGSNMCRGSYYEDGKCCLTGWINANFLPNEQFDVLDNDDFWGRRTKANKRAKEVMEKVIVERHYQSQSDFDGIEHFNDYQSKNLGLSLAYLAKLYNTMLYKLGYNIKKEDRLEDK